MSFSHEEPGWRLVAMGDYCRGLWYRTSPGRLEVCGGRDGDDWYVSLVEGETVTAEHLYQLEAALATVPWAAEHAGEDDERARVTRAEATAEAARRDREFLEGEVERLTAELAEERARADRYRRRAFAMRRRVAAVRSTAEAFRRWWHTVVALIEHEQTRAEAAEAEARRLRDVVAAFVDTVESLTRYHETKGKGGQHVSFHGDFVNAPPSVVAKLQWWARELTAALAADKPRAELEDLRNVMPGGERGSR